MDISPGASHHRHCLMFPFVRAVSFCPNRIRSSVRGKDTHTGAMGPVKSNGGNDGAKKVKQGLRRMRCKKKQGETKGVCFALLRHDRSNGGGENYIPVDILLRKDIPNCNLCCRLKIRRHRDAITCSSGTPPGLPADPEAPWTDRPAPATLRTFHPGICGSSCNGRRRGRHLRDGGHHRRRNG